MSGTAQSNSKNKQCAQKGPFDTISSDFQQMQIFRRSQIWGDPYIPSIIVTFLGQILQSDLIEVREYEEKIRNGVCLDIECF